jgi:hypothetical protein
VLSRSEFRERLRIPVEGLNGLRRGRDVGVLMGQCYPLDVSVLFDQEPGLPKQGIPTRGFLAGGFEVDAEVSDLSQEPGIRWWSRHAGPGGAEARRRPRGAALASARGVLT